jgi:hypothetical protein
VPAPRLQVICRLPKPCRPQSANRALKFHARIFRFILKEVRRSWIDVTADLAGRLASPRETLAVCTPGLIAAENAHGKGVYIQTLSGCRM